MGLLSTLTCLHTPKATGADVAPVINPSSATARKWTGGKWNQRPQKKNCCQINTPTNVIGCGKWHQTQIITSCKKTPRVPRAKITNKHYTVQQTTTTTGFIFEFEYESDKLSSPGRQNQTGRQVTDGSARCSCRLLWDRWKEMDWTVKVTAVCTGTRWMSGGTSTSSPSYLLQRKHGGRYNLPRWPDVFQKGTFFRNKRPPSWPKALENGPKARVAVGNNGRAAQDEAVWQQNLNFMT